MFTVHCFVVPRLDDVLDIEHRNLSKDIHPKRAALLCNEKVTTDIDVQHVISSVNHNNERNGFGGFCYTASVTTFNFISHKYNNI